jgi:hypothetical protein
VIVVTDGGRAVAFVRVDNVLADPLSSALPHLDLGSLVGSTDEKARRRVETTGGIYARMKANPAFTRDLVQDRVIAQVDAGKVAAVRGLG